MTKFRLSGKFSCLFPVLFLLIITFCSKKSEKDILAKFDEGVVTQDEYIEHFLLSTMYKPELMPTQENLEKIVRMKAFEKLTVLEALAQHIDHDSLFQALVARNEKKIAFQYYMQKIIIDSVVTDSLIQKYYTEFSPQYRMSYIIRPVIKSSTSEFEQSQKDTIDYAYRLLRQGKKFEMIAKRFSQDITTNQKGGDLGWVIRESLGDAALRATMDTLKKFSYSAPVRGYEGYYILYKGENREVTIPPFNEAQIKIRKGLTHNRQHVINDLLDEHFHKIAPKYKFQTDEDILGYIIKKTCGDTNSSALQSFNGKALSVDDLLMVIARYEGEKITVFDVLRELQKEPKDIKEFKGLLKKVSQRQLIGKYAMESKLFQIPELQQEIQLMKNSLLKDLLLEKNINNQIKIQMDVIKNMEQIPSKEKGKYLQQKRQEIEKALKQDYENKILDKYHLKFCTENYKKALEVAKEKKLNIKTDY